MNIQSTPANSSIILQGTLDQYIQDVSKWAARYFTLLNDGTLQFYENKLETSNRLGILMINYDVQITKSESTEDGQTRQTIQLDATHSLHGKRKLTTVLIGARYKSVQEAWFQMLSRFAGTSKTIERSSSTEISLDNFQFEGPLEKRGYWNPSWKSRYFVLSKQGSLSYFAAESEKSSPEPLGTVPMRNAVITSIPGASGRPQFTIQVQSPGSPAHGRTFNLAAPNDTALARWLRELGRAARPECDNSRHATPVAAAAAGGGGGGATDADTTAERKDR
jgi:hypothetical protein